MKMKLNLILVVTRNLIGIMMSVFIKNKTQHRSLKKILMSLDHQLHNHDKVCGVIEVNVTNTLSLKKLMQK